MRVSAEALAKAGSFGGFRRSFDRRHGCEAVGLHGRIHQCLFKGQDAMVQPKALSCEVVSTLEGWLNDHRYDDIRALSDGVRRLTPLFTRGRDQNVFRVVSELRHMTGEKRAWLCNETGREEAGGLDRAGTERKKDVDDWHRGAIVKVAEWTRTTKRKADAVDGMEKQVEGKLGRIPSTASVELVRPA